MPLPLILLLSAWERPSSDPHVINLQFPRLYLPQSQEHTEAQKVGMMAKLLHSGSAK